MSEASSTSDNFDSIQVLEADTKKLQGYPDNKKGSDVNKDSDSVEEDEEEIFYDTLEPTGDISELRHQTDASRHVDSDDNDRSSEEKNNEDQDVGYNLPPEFLQRSPSHITIKNITLSRKRYNTYPNLQKEFDEAKKKMNLKSQMSTPVGDSNFSESLDMKTEATSVSAMQGGGKKSVTFELRSSEEEPTCPQVKDASNKRAIEELDSPQVTDDFTKHDEDITNETIEEVDSNEARNILNELTDNSGEKDSDILKSSVCMECVKAIEVNSRDEIKPGDHITFSGRVYDHHAIVIEVKDLEEEDASKIHIEIVHATNTSAKATFASLHPFGNKARLRQVSEIVNLTEKKVMVYIYNSRMNPFPPPEIIQRAKAEAKADIEGGQGQFKYNLFQNNCEHFATWCVTGRKLSLQVRKFSMVFWMFLKSGFYGISDEFLRNEKEYENGMLCESCYLRNKKILKIPKTTIVEADQVKAGDIITYSYYFLWHSAVVLEILNTTDNYVECEIAHYAYLGPFKHREIRNETLIIPLNGSVFLTIYPENFDVYTLEEVVERARSRIGEQMFAFFSNDSSQFARWCKLKLQKQAT